MAESINQASLGRIHAEWLNANLSRAYPLADYTGGRSDSLPCRLLADAFVLIYGNTNEAETVIYIEKVVSSSTEVVFHLAGEFSGKSVSFGPVATFHRTAEIGTAAPFEVLVDGFTVTGKLVVGDIANIVDLPAVLELTADGGLLSPGCYRVAPPTLQGLEVDGTIYTGVVELQAGDGLSVEASTDADTGITTLTIAVRDYEIPEDNKLITTDKQLLAMAMADYGDPVCSINEVIPDYNGNIAIVADEQSVTSAEATIDMKLVVDKVSSESGAIQVTITRPQECEVATVIERLLEMLQQLNLRAAVLDNSITAIDVAQANLAARLTGLA